MIKIKTQEVIMRFPGIVVLSLIVAVNTTHAELTREQTEFFENKVRPVLVENCYKCHSEEQGKSKGGLTLDTRDGWMKGGDDGLVIAPGDPDHSSLIRAVRYEDPDLQMPPKDNKLKDEDIQVLVKWVKMGAPDPRMADKQTSNKKLSGLNPKARSFWAYQPVKKAIPPEVKNAAWCSSPIDRFIMAKLEEKKMTPSDPASKEALIRRAYYDLVGLPPSPQEIQDFIKDDSPQAFARVVDHLLASPHYGERWGRHWLDTVRYSDTTGAERNQANKYDYRFPYAWTYRDYVIDAFNNDKPYNEFILEQIAGDKLPSIGSNNKDLAALGFLTVGKKFQNVNDSINDQIDTLSKTFTAQTVSCARCHDHKFDPISMNDYYALRGVFISTTQPRELPVIGEGDPAHAPEFQKKLAALENENRRLYYGFLDDILSDLHHKSSSYLRVIAYLASKGNREKNLKESEAIIQREKLDPIISRYFSNRLKRDSVFAPFLALAQIDDPNFEKVARKLLENQKMLSRRKKGNSVRMNPLIMAELEKSPLQSIDDVIGVYVNLFNMYESQYKAYLQACKNATTDKVAGFSKEVVDLIQSPYEILPAPLADTAGIREFISKSPFQMVKNTPWVFSKINELELTNPGTPIRAMVVSDVPNPRDSPIFIRGLAEVRGDLVPRRTVGVYCVDGKTKSFVDGSGRLELAKSIATPSNPLTARVMVNRVWMYHFGSGIVSSPDYFGTLSEAPSHPELLDYLANYFVDNGWSIKKLHRFVMLSSVYQESTQTNQAFEKMDPENRYLWRANIRRLDFESMRDTLLAFSNKLDQQIGGQPVNLTDEPYSYRRSVYGYIDRGKVPELMNQFDFPDPNMTNSKRDSTIVPQQALFLMNNSMVVDTVRRINRRKEVVDAKTDSDRLFQIYRIIFQRAPREKELELGLSFLAQEKSKQAKLEMTLAPAMMKRDQQKTKQIAKRNQNMKLRRDGAQPILNEGETVAVRPLSPWETYTQALLFSNEASYVN